MLLTCIQRAQLLAQQARQHGNDSVHQVDTSAPLAGLCIQCAARWRKESHVSNVHAHTEGAPRQCLD